MKKTEVWLNAALDTLMLQWDLIEVDQKLE